MTRPRSHDPAAADHAAHDPLVVAALAAGDLQPPALLATRELVGTCPECRRLHDDLLALSRATVQLPPPGRTADFRIDAARARALRSPSARVRERLGGLTAGIRRPLAAGFVALGTAGLLFVAISSAPGAGTIGSGRTTDQAYRTEVASPIAGDADAQGAAPSPLEVVPRAPEGARDQLASPPGATGPVAPAATAGKGAAGATAERSPTNQAGDVASVPWLLLGSLGLLAVGLGLSVAGAVRRR